jgi:Lrp/AsnC family transcriptional regulator, leucine-responsive regulatory protein
MYKLGAKDKKILYLLHKNCRLSNSKIARLVGISKDGVKYKINKFERDGLIRGYFLNLRTIKQGYVTYVVFLRLRNVGSKRLAQIINSIINKKHVIYCATCFGAWDISLQIMSRSIFTFENYINEIIDLIGNQLTDYQTFISIKEYKIYSNITDKYFGNIRFKFKPLLNRFKKLILDATDKKILLLLSENARMPLHIIAKRVNKSLDVVRYRIKRIENNGYIYSYDVLLDSAMMGYSMNVLFLQMHNLTREKENRLAGFFQYHPDIRWAHKTTGQQIILVETLTNSQESFQNLITELKNRFSDMIVSYDSILEFKKYKDITLPDLDELERI